MVNNIKDEIKEEIHKEVNRMGDKMRDETKPVVENFGGEIDHLDSLENIKMEAAGKQIKDDLADQLKQCIKDELNTLKNEMEKFQNETLDLKIDVDNQKQNIRREQIKKNKTENIETKVDSLETDVTTLKQKIEYHKIPATKLEKVVTATMFLV